ncbi:hypothetical protein BGZ73_004336 [Actinomortierella ambigua]|nr:hypothetical protein BGZ73_004336 [Actinomortierella ambigua]
MDATTTTGTTQLPPLPLSPIPSDLMGRLSLTEPSLGTVPSVNAILAEPTPAMATETPSRPASPTLQAPGLDTAAIASDNSGVIRSPVSLRGIREADRLGLLGPLLPSTQSRVQFVATPELVPASSSSDSNDVVGLGHGAVFGFMEEDEPVLDTLPHEPVERVPISQRQRSYEDVHWMYTRRRQERIQSLLDILAGVSSESGSTSVASSSSSAMDTRSNYYRHHHPVGLQAANDSQPTSHRVDEYSDFVGLGLNRQQQRGLQASAAPLPPPLASSLPPTSWSLQNRQDWAAFAAANSGSYHHALATATAPICPSVAEVLDGDGNPIEFPSWLSAPGSHSTSTSSRRRAGGVSSGPHNMPVGSDRPMLPFYVSQGRVRVVSTGTVFEGYEHVTEADTLQIENYRYLKAPWLTNPNGESWSDDETNDGYGSHLDLEDLEDDDDHADKDWLERMQVGQPGQHQQQLSNMSLAGQQAFYRQGTNGLGTVPTNADERQSREMYDLGELLSFESQAFESLGGQSFDHAHLGDNATTAAAATAGAESRALVSLSGGTVMTLGSSSSPSSSSSFGATIERSGSTEDDEGDMVEAVSLSGGLSEGLEPEVESTRDDRSVVSSVSATESVVLPGPRTSVGVAMASIMGGVTGGAMTHHHGNGSTLSLVSNLSSSSTSSARTTAAVVGMPLNRHHHTRRLLEQQRRLGGNLPLAISLESTEDDGHLSSFPTSASSVGQPEVGGPSARTSLYAGFMEYGAGGSQYHESPPRHQRPLGDEIESVLEGMVTPANLSQSATTTPPFSSTPRASTFQQLRAQQHQQQQQQQQQQPQSHSRPPEALQHQLPGSHRLSAVSSSSAMFSDGTAMMSRTPPALPPTRGANEPIAHQIRRAQSTIMFLQQRQWEMQLAQQQQQQQQQRTLDPTTNTSTTPAAAPSSSSFAPRNSRRNSNSSIVHPRPLLPLTSPPRTTTATLPPSSTSASTSAATSNYTTLSSIYLSPAFAPATTTTLGTTVTAPTMITTGTGLGSTATVVAASSDSRLMSSTTSSLSTASASGTMATAATGRLYNHCERLRIRGSNSLYMNYEGGTLKPHERWRRGAHEMVGR